MRTNLRVVTLCLGLLLLLLVPAITLADESVQLTVYYSPKCEHCQIALTEVFPPLMQAYGDRLQITFVDVTNPEGLSQLEATEARLGKKNNPFPVVQYGDQLMASEDVFALQKTLQAFLSAKLGAPAAGATVSAPLTSTGAAALPTAPGTSKPGVATINMAYVEKDGCEKCARAQVVLDAVQNDYPTLSIRVFNNVRDADLLEAMGQALKLPEQERLVAPAVYVGSDALVGEQLTSGALRTLLDKYVATGAPAFWERLSAESGKTGILARFRSMGPWAVVLAAALDGINPCAFATIIFFVWYLAVSARPRREMILVGLAFTLGVFMTYFLVGIGAMGLLQLASRVHVLAKIIYGVFAASCFVFATLSVRDYFLARQGHMEEMTLRLPDVLRNRIKGRIRKLTGAFAGATFLSGAFIALLELACTGQVYLPTITFVVGIPGMRTQALLYLLLYNLIFVVPILLVLFLVVYGVNPARFQDWLKQNTARTKLGTALLFVLLGVLLLTQVSG